jgi:hypothetical protein
MSDSSVQIPVKPVPSDTVPLEKNGHAPRVTKAKDYVGLLVAAFPLVGALGTAFVWAMAYFYVGSVDLSFNKPYHSLTVDVYNPKGSQTSFHTPHFELMPGHYFFQIAVDGKPPINCPADVVYGQNTKVQVDEPQPVVTSEASSSAEEETTPQKKRKWWQFWRR